MDSKPAVIVGNVLFFAGALAVLTFLVMTIFWDPIGMWVVGMLWPGVR